MKKIIILGGVILLVVVALFLYKGDKVEYVQSINDEVVALETELAEIEMSIKNGTLTPEEAVKAQSRIMVRLDNINTKSSTKINDLSPEQKTLLASTLDRLGKILVTYRDTLNKVDETAATLPESERRELNPRGSRSASLTVAVAETLENVGEVAEEMIEDFDADLEIYTEPEDFITDEINGEVDMQGTLEVGSVEVESSESTESEIIIDSEETNEATMETDAEMEVENEEETMAQ